MTTPAYAVMGFAEVGGGITQLRSADPFFGSGLPPQDAWGVAIDSGIYLTVSDGRSPVEFQFGLQERLSTASFGGTNEGFLALYPSARVQFARMFISGGVTPLNWIRTAPALGFDGFSRSPSDLSYFVELGMLFPLTPKFSFGAAASLAYVKSAFGLGPAPIIDLTASMHFHFGSAGGSNSGSGEEGHSNEFQGWRYPFGEMR